MSNEPFTRIRYEVVAYSYALDRSIYRSRVAAAHEELDERTWAETWSAERTMAFKQAMAYALEEKPGAAAGDTEAQERISS